MIMMKKNKRQCSTTDAVQQQELLEVVGEEGGIWELWEYYYIAFLWLFLLHK